MKRKGETKMTNVLLTNVGTIINNYENSKVIQKKKSSIIDILFSYIRIKNMLKSFDSQKLINNYITKDKKVNSGRATIKGTRVTPEDICRVLFEEENMDIKGIMKELPSLETEEQVMAGIVYYAKTMSILKIVRYK